MNIHIYINFELKSHLRRLNEEIQVIQFEELLQD